MPSKFKQRLAEELQKQSANAGNQQLPSSDLAKLPDETQKEIHAFAAEQTKDLDSSDTHGMGFYCGAVSGIVIGAASYANKLQQAETHNGLLKTEIKHLNTVIEKLSAQTGDTFLLNRLGVTLENIYRIHSVQWNEYDRSVIRGILDQWEQSKKDADPVDEAKDVFWPCAEDDPETCGSYTSHDGRSLCYVKVKHIAAATLTQERADLIREANNRDLDGISEAASAQWVKGVPQSKRQHFAKVKSMIEDDVIYDAIIWPIEGSEYWWCVGQGFKFDAPPAVIVAHLDMSGGAAYELEKLRQWKEEAKQLIDPIMAYAQGHKDAKLGGSCIEFVINRCKGYDELKSAGESDAVELIQYIRENYKPSKEVWKDKFGIALLSDQGVLNMYKQKIGEDLAEWPGEKEV